MNTQTHVIISDWKVCFLLILFFLQTDTFCFLDLLSFSWKMCLSACPLQHPQDYLISDIWDELWGILQVSRRWTRLISLLRSQLPVPNLHQSQIISRVICKNFHRPIYRLYELFNVFFGILSWETGQRVTYQDHSIQINQTWWKPQNI